MLPSSLFLILSLLVSRLRTKVTSQQMSRGTKENIDEEINATVLILVSTLFVVLASSSRLRADEMNK